MIRMAAVAVNDDYDPIIRQRLFSISETATWRDAYLQAISLGIFEVPNTPVEKLVEAEEVRLDTISSFEELQEALTSDGVSLSIIILNVPN